MNSNAKSCLLLGMVLTLAACGGGGGDSANNNSPAQSNPTAVIVSTNTSAAAKTGSPLQLTLGSTIKLNGTNSTAPDSTITAFHWTLISAPTGSKAVITTPNSGNSSFSPDVLGSYTLQLTVTNAKGISASENITVDVLNTPPATSVVNSVIFSGKSSVQPTQTVSTGSIISLDATGSTDPDGQAVTVSWQLIQKPAGSTAALTINGKLAYFTPDQLGVYQVRARGADASGAYSDVIYTYNANNTSPTTVVVASAQSALGSGAIKAATGYMVILNGTGSSAPDNHTLTKSWAILSKPAASTVALGAPTTDSISFVPDVAGNYLVQLTVHDNVTGADNRLQTTVEVVASPTANVTGTALPIVLATEPSFLLEKNASVTLRSNSISPDGSALSYDWKVISQPAGSKATIATPAAGNISFTPDANGMFVIQLTVSSAAGGSTTQNITLNVGTYAPVAIIDQPSITLTPGNIVNASAAMSYDLDSPALTYSWAIDAKPAASTATIANPSLPDLAFTPDVPGTYYATVSVSDGTSTSVAGLVIYVIGATPGTVPLSYVPQQSLYDKALGKVIIASAGPSALHIVDPETTSDVKIVLPNSVKAMSLSPDGKLAAVLYEGVVSLVDLNSHTIVKSTTTGGSQTDVAINNNGEIYLTGQTGGQWVTPAITRINGTTGALLQSWTSNSSGVYGTTKWIYSDVNNKIFSISRGIFPADIYAQTLSPASGDVVSAKDSPYHGTYVMSDPLWLSGDQSLLFTSAGTYFNTSDLTYVGKFTYTGTLLSMSHSSTLQEAALLVGTPNYPSVYKRFTGSLLFPAADVPLPLIGGQQSYGLSMFHATDDSHVMVVQTGTSASNGAGASYYVIRR